MKTRGRLGNSTVWLLLIAVFFGCDTAKNVEDPALNYFVKYYGGDGDQYGVDLLPLADGSFLLLGTDVYNGVHSRLYVVRVDALGDVMWEQRYGELGKIVTAKDLTATADGNFIVLADFQAMVGETNIIQTDIRLLKIDPEGVVLQTKEFGTVADESGNSITLLKDGGFMISGTTELTDTYGEPDPDLGDAMTYRLDQNLNDLDVDDWYPRYHGFISSSGGANLDVAVRGIERDTIFYFFGYTNSTLSNLNPNRRLGLFYFQRGKTGSLGPVWYPGNVVNVNDTKIHFVERVAPELGEGFIVIGTSQNNIGLSDIFVARLRGTLSFAAPLQNDAMVYTTVGLGGKNVRGVAAASSTTGQYGYLILGNEVRSSGATNLWLSKINQSGTVLWSTSFGSEDKADVGAAVTELPDGKILVLGTMRLADSQFKMALIKMNPRGELLK